MQDTHCLHLCGQRFAVQQGLKSEVTSSGNWNRLGGTYGAREAIVTKIQYGLLPTPFMNGHVAGSVVHNVYFDFLKVSSVPRVTPLGP